MPYQIRISRFLCLYHHAFLGKIAREFPVAFSNVWISQCFLLLDWLLPMTRDPYLRDYLTHSLIGFMTFPWILMRTISVTVLQGIWIRLADSTYPVTICYTICTSSGTTIIKKILDQQYAHNFLYSHFAKKLTL